MLQRDPEVLLFNSFQYRDVMNDFTYILLSVWFAWCQVFVSEVVVGMLRVPSLWLLLCCVHIVLIRILFLDERGICCSSLSEVRKVWD